MNQRLIRTSTRLSLIAAFLAVGCDPVRRVEQRVVFEITTLDGKQLPCSVSVAIREQYTVTEDDLEFEQVNPNRGKQLCPWTEDVMTDNMGRAVITYGRGALDWNKGAIPPESRYPIDDRVFDVRIKGCDGEVDEFQSKISQGTVARGESHEIRVKKVSDAVYVDVD